MKSRFEQGTALVGSLAIMIALVGVSAIYLYVSHAAYESSNGELAGIRARLASEEGLHLAMAELKIGVDTGNDGLGNVTLNGADGRVVSARAQDLGGELYLLHGSAGVQRASLGTEVLAVLIPADPLNAPVRGAITAEGPVVTTGSIIVDGRDWDPTGTVILGPGTFGISTMQLISQNGSSAIGGKGIAPDKPAPPGTTEPFAVWNDGLDNDGDTLVDEEAYDGVDNDGDGLIDEDTFDYPNDPDVALRLPVGSLKAAAQAAGTYFTDQASLDAWIQANGNNLPGGVIVYAEFDTWQPVNLGNGWNEPPSVIVHHNASGTALMKNIHGAFKGLVMPDFVQHINGDFIMLGAIMSFADESIGNAFGNGNADVMYSSAVLGNLPAANTENRIRVVSWRRAAAQ